MLPQILYQKQNKCPELQAGSQIVEYCVELREDLSVGGTSLPSPSYSQGGGLVPYQAA